MNARLFSDIVRANEKRAVREANIRARQSAGVMKLKGNPQRNPQRDLKSKFPHTDAVVTYVPVVPRNCLDDLD